MLHACPEYMVECCLALQKKLTVHSILCRVGHPVHMTKWVTTVCRLGHVNNIEVARGASPVTTQ